MTLQIASWLWNFTRPTDGTVDADGAWPDGVIPALLKKRILCLHHTVAAGAFGRIKGIVSTPDHGFEGDIFLLKTG